MKNHRIVIGDIEKNGREIVRVIRTRLNGHELVHLPVYSVGGKRDGTERGIALTLDQWRQVIPMIEQALEIEFTSKRPVSSTPSLPSSCIIGGRKPARRKE